MVSGGIKFALSGYMPFMTIFHPQVKWPLKAFCSTWTILNLGGCCNLARTNLARFHIAKVLQSCND